MDECSLNVPPADVQASFRPAVVLKGKIGNAVRGITVRKLLVVFQFVMALGLLICTFAVFRQISFMKNRNLGFTLENKLVVRAPRVRGESFGSRLATFKEQLLKNSDIRAFCVGTEVPGRQILWDAGGIRRVGTNDNKNYQILGIDYDYVKVFGLKLVAGRNFAKEYPSDASALLLNETAAKWLGFESPKAAIAQKIIYWDNIYTVVGVLADADLDYALWLLGGVCLAFAAATRLSDLHLQVVRQTNSNPGARTENG